MMLRLSQMFPGWAEATQLMVVGEKRRAWVPAGFAYGDNPKAGQPAGDLTLDIELVDLVKLGDAPEVPKDLKDPPPSAKRLPSGVAYAVLKPGNGRTPGPDDAVVLNYSGFMTDGTVFDSSIPKGRAVAVRISKAVKGWAEGLLLMKEGEKAQFWVPAALAYGDTPAKAGGPHGNIVFVAELVKIKEPAVAQK
jgi:peptidylprolyl isomerase